VNFNFISLILSTRIHGLWNELKSSPYLSLDQIPMNSKYKARVLLRGGVLRSGIYVVWDVLKPCGYYSYHQVYHSTRQEMYI